MGGAKRMMEEADNKMAAATGILTAVGIYRPCPVHEDVLLTAGLADLTPAYKYGNFYWANYEGVFKSRQEMTDTIKEVFGGFEVAALVCPFCASNAASD